MKPNNSSNQLLNNNSNLFKSNISQYQPQDMTIDNLLGTPHIYHEVLNNNRKRSLTEFLNSMSIMDENRLGMSLNGSKLSYEKPGMSFMTCDFDENQGFQGDAGQNNSQRQQQNISHFDGEKQDYSKIEFQEEHKISLIEKPSDKNYDSMFSRSGQREMISFMQNNSLNNNSLYSDKQNKFGLSNNNNDIDQVNFLVTSNNNQDQNLGLSGHYQQEQQRKESNQFQQQQQQQTQKGNLQNNHSFLQQSNISLEQDIIDKINPDSFFTRNIYDRCLNYRNNQSSHYLQLEQQQTAIPQNNNINSSQENSTKTFCLSFNIDQNVANPQEKQLMQSDSINQIQQNSFHLNSLNNMSQNNFTMSNKDMSIIKQEKSELEQIKEEMFQNISSSGLKYPLDNKHYMQQNFEQLQQLQNKKPKPRRKRETNRSHMPTNYMNLLIPYLIRCYDHQGLFQKRLYIRKSNNNNQQQQKQQQSNAVRYCKQDCRNCHLLDKVVLAKNRFKNNFNIEKIQEFYNIEEDFRQKARHYIQNVMRDQLENSKKHKEEQKLGLLRSINMLLEAC